MRQPRFVRAAGNGRGQGQGLWFIFNGDKLLLAVNSASARPLDTAEIEALGPLPERAHLLGFLDGQACLAVELAAGANPETLQGPAPRPPAVDLRQAYGMLPELEYAIAGYASQVLHWDRTTHFCPVCGTRVEQLETERAKRCPACGFLQYPRVSPAIITLIYRPGQVLLTRQASWPQGRYSLVAGFVEAGESLEECLRREVAEEVGVAVDEIRYLGSQPWPFPHQLMVGFLARYQAGEVAIDAAELEHAAWFDLDALPDLPPPLSISRRILDWHLAAQRDPALPFPVFDTLG